jgi:glucokinase
MFVAVDIGGTKTLLALFDDSGRLTQKDKITTEHDFSSFQSNLLNALDRLTAGQDVKAVGLAMPGQIDYDSGRGLIFGNLPWENVDVAASVKERLRVPVVVENDANAAGLAEARALEPSSPSVVYVTVSTGIGTGLITDNRIDPAWRQSEGGFMHFVKDGQLLPWEKFASGHAIKERFGRIAADIPEGDIAWTEIAYDLALGLSNIAALLAPKTIIIGGGVGEHLPKFKRHLDQAMSRLKEKMFMLPDIRQAQHPEEAVVYGCYHLAKDALNA